VASVALCVGAIWQVLALWRYVCWCSAIASSVASITARYGTMLALCGAIGVKCVGAMCGAMAQVWRYVALCVG
jgi:hypothetical protein